MQHLTNEEIALLCYHTLDAFQANSRYTGEALNLIQDEVSIEDIYIKRMIRYMRWSGLLGKRGGTSNALYEITEAGIAVVRIFGDAL